MNRSEFDWRNVEHIIFLLEHLESMKEGRSPFSEDKLLVKPQKLGYSKTAPFAPACEMIAALEMRLDNCVIRHNDIEGKLIWLQDDGILLRWHYCEGKSVRQIAGGSMCAEAGICDRMDKALRYITGLKPRRKSYTDYCCHPTKRKVML